MTRPLAPPAEPIDHAPTAGLIGTLTRAGWELDTIDSGTATLVHPHRNGEPIVVVADAGNPGRLEAVHIGERQVTFRMATAYAFGAVDA